MKILLPLLVLILGMNLRAEDDVDRRPAQSDVGKKAVQDPLIVRALVRLEERLGIRFEILFPKDFDIDDWKKLPLAKMEVNDRKILITRPIVNPFDQPRTVEWMQGPEDVKKLGQESVDCAFDLDERGEFSRLNLQADWATDGKGNHQLWRGENESGRDFFERARLTYRDRAGKAEDAASAQLHLAAFEKVAFAIQTLRKEETHQAPGLAK